MRKVYVTATVKLLITQDDYSGDLQETLGNLSMEPKHEPQSVHDDPADIEVLETTYTVTDSK